MKVVIQRVSQANVLINQSETNAINAGLVLLLGYGPNDTIEDINWITSKIINLRLFSDEKNLMNLSIQDVKGELLCISQFTLFASTKKGNRPSFINAAKPDQAKTLYDLTINTFKKIYPNRIKTGQFGADMQVSITNNGPVTIILDSKNKV